MILDINKIIKIVKEAGELFKNRDFDVEHKTSISDKVTSMDIEVEHFLKESFLKLLPDSGFLGEESDAHEIDKEHVWVVDPIDGTTNFVRDLAISSISVGLLKDGKPIIGLVYNPYRDEMFYAQKGMGAYLNGKKIEVSNLPFESSIYYTSLSPYTKKSTKICVEILQEVYSQTDDFRRLGSAAIELCLLACGRGELYFEMHLQPWDYAAGAFILQEAAGYAGTVGNGEFKYDGPIPVFAANSKDNFDKLGEIVNRHI